MTRAKRSARSGWRRLAGDPAAVGPLLREARFLATDQDPVSAVAHFDANGRLRRIDAHYDCGWSAVLHVSANGDYTLNQSIRMVWRPDR